eukprot:scaffold25704_cov101-Isochrysis_galbana.AAC.1
MGAPSKAPGGGHVDAHAGEGGSNGRAHTRQGRKCGKQAEHTHRSGAPLHPPRRSARPEGGGGRVKTDERVFCEGPLGARREIAHLKVSVDDCARLNGGNVRRRKKRLVGTRAGAGRLAHGEEGCQEHGPSSMVTCSEEHVAAL